MHGFKVVRLDYWKYYEAVLSTKNRVCCLSIADTKKPRTVQIYYTAANASDGLQMDTYIAIVKNKRKTDSIRKE